MLQNEYLVAKIGFDSAENEPLKVCQKIATSLKIRTNIGPREGEDRAARRRRPRHARDGHFEVHQAPTHHPALRDSRDAQAAALGHGLCLF